MSSAQGQVCCQFCGDHLHRRDQSYSERTGEGRSVQGSEGTLKMTMGFDKPAGPELPWGTGAEGSPPSKPGAQHPGLQASLPLGEALVT